MRFKLFALMTSLTILSGCSTFKIHQKGLKDSIEGIPFYSHKQIIKQTTVINRNWLVANIKYQVFDDSKENKALGLNTSFPISLKNYDSSLLEKWVNEAEVDIKQNDVPAANAFQYIREKLNSSSLLIDENILLAEADPNLTSLTLLQEYMVSNVYIPEVIVDYTQTFLFNSKVYPFSTTNTNITMAANGTLTSATNNVDTTKLADLIPLNEFITDKLKIGAEATSDDDDTGTSTTDDGGAFASLVDAGGAGGANRSYQLTFSTEIKGFQYTLTKTHEYHPCDTSTCTPLKLTGDGVSVVRTPIGTTKPKKDDKSFKISGKITPPSK